jgi:hypothetical protein
MMIKTLEDVQIYWEQDAIGSEPHPLADAVRIPAPGLPADEITRLRSALPGLPDDYLDVIAKLDLETAEIQFCPMTTCSYGKRRGEMVQCLLKRNSDENWALELLTEHLWYEVASWNGDPICVASRDSAHPGEVFRIDHETQSIYRIANSFDQVVIGFTRLDDQDRTSGPRGEEGAELFLTSVKEDFDLDDEQMEEWTSIAEILLYED